MSNRFTRLALGLLVGLGIACILSCGGQGPNLQDATKTAKTQPSSSNPSKISIETANSVKSTSSVDPLEGFEKPIEQRAHDGMNRIKRQVAEDAVKQYEIAKRHSTAIDVYVHAGLVAAAYLQAEDEANYQKWKEIEADDGAAAGIPLPKAVVHRRMEKAAEIAGAEAKRESESAANILAERRRLADEEKAAKKETKRKFEKEHPNETAQKKFAGVLKNARNLIKAKIYTGAEKSLRRIIKEAPGTDVAKEAEQVLESMPKTP